MANQVNIESFETRVKLLENTEQLLRTSIQSKLDSGNSITVLLSGGSTPIPLYKKIGIDTGLVESVNWVLVDERYVPISDKFSNEGMIRSCLGTSASITGMIYDAMDYDTNLLLAKKVYERLHNEIDFALVGMGNDGHIASLFPREENSKLALVSKEHGIFNTFAPSEPIQRISCGLQMLIQCKVICILLTGKEKYHLVNQAEGNLPVHQLLKLRPDSFIYYAD